MKRIIRLTESELIRIVNRIVKEESYSDMVMGEDCPDSLCYQYDYNNDVCVHVKDMKSKKLMDMWYEEKTESEKYDWFFNLIYDDRDVIEYYQSLKESKDGNWNKNSDIFFFRRLSVEYCKGDESEGDEKSQSGMDMLIKYVKSNTCGGGTKSEPV
jgi:hypothetical protein